MTTTSNLLQLHQQIINKIWSNCKTAPQVPKPMVSYTRPKNIRDIVTRARLPTDDKPQPKLMNVGRSSISKIQLITPTDFVTFRCTADHRYTTDEFDCLDQAYKAMDANDIAFVNSHRKCGNISCIPTRAESTILVKCTECEYQYKFTTPTPPSKFLTEIRNTVLTMQRCRFRPEKHPIIRCKYLSCDCCKYKDPRNQFNYNGIHCRPLACDCNISNVIYNAIYIMSAKQ